MVSLPATAPSFVRCSQGGDVAGPLFGHFGQEGVIGLSRASGLVEPLEVEVEGLALSFVPAMTIWSRGAGGVRPGRWSSPRCTPACSALPRLLLHAHPPDAEPDPSLATELDVQVGQLVLLPLLALQRRDGVPVWVFGKWSRTVTDFGNLNSYRSLSTVRLLGVEVGRDRDDDHDDFSGRYRPAEAASPPPREHPPRIGPGPGSGPTQWLPESRRLRSKRRQ